MSERTVIHLVLTEHFAGVERHIGDLSAALAQRGWRMVVATGPRPAPAATRHYERSGAEVVALRGSGALAVAGELRRLVRSKGAAIVHAHLGNAMLAAALGAGGKPVVVTQHFIRPRHLEARAASLKAPAHAWVLRRSAAVIAISEAVRAAVAPTLTGARTQLVTIPHGIPDLPVRAPAAMTAREHALLFMGRMSPEKGPLLAIEAVASAGGRWEFWMAGTGDIEAEVRRTGERVLGSRFRFHGFTEDVDKLYARAQALVMPSREEPFGLVAVEALRAGLPVIASRAGALPEIVDDSVGRLVEGEPSALASAISEVMADPALAARLGSAGRARYLSSFQAARMAERTAALYGDLLS